MVANDVWIEGKSQSAKVRSPWLVLLFTLLTLGVYAPFWWYFINRELADLGRARRVRDLGDSPGVSVLAFTLGWFVSVPWVWTIVTTNRRVRAAQELTVGRTHNVKIAAALWVFTLTLGGLVYLQYELNKVWRAPAMLPKEERDWRIDDLERISKLDELQAAGALSEEEHRTQRVRLGV